VPVAGERCQFHQTDRDLLIIQRRNGVAELAGVGSENFGGGSPVGIGVHALKLAQEEIQIITPTFDAGHGANIIDAKHGFETGIVPQDLEIYVGEQALRSGISQRQRPFRPGKCLWLVSQGPVTGRNEVGHHFGHEA